MKLKQFFADDDAVSPVIGVILMVAITVILAAVIASFVLGLGDQNNPAPTTSFNFDYDGSGTSLDITHEDGDQLTQTEMYLRGENLASTGQISSTFSISGSEWKAGESLTVGTSNDAWVARIVWEDPDSDQTSTLDDDEGPDA